VYNTKDSAPQLVYVDTRVIGESDPYVIDNSGFYKIKSQVYGAAISIFARNTDSDQPFTVTVKNSVLVRCEKIEGPLDLNTIITAGGIAADGGFLLVTNVCGKKCIGDTSSTAHRSCHLFYYTRGNITNLLAYQCPGVDASAKSLFSHLLKQRGSDTTINYMNASSCNHLALPLDSDSHNQRFIQTRGESEEDFSVAYFSYLNVINNHYHDFLFSDNINLGTHLTIVENSSVTQFVITSPKYAFSRLEMINIINYNVYDIEMKEFKFETRRNQEERLFLRDIYIGPGCKINWNKETVRFRNQSTGEYYKFDPSVVNVSLLVTDQEFPITIILGPDKKAGKCKVSGYSDDDDGDLAQNVQSYALYAFIAAGCIGLVCLIIIPTICHFKHQKERNDLTSSINF